MKNEWIEVMVELPAAWAEEVSVYLIGMGSNGVVTGGGAVDAFEIADEKREKAELKACFAPEDAPARVSELKRYLEGVGLSFGISVSTVEDGDWAHKWKRFFKPERVTDKIVIKPTWEPYEATEGEIVVEIDPGMAFGTGTHPTTRGCLRLIEEVVAKGGIGTMLDVGTGSGILSIAAAKMGVPEVTAIDIDPEAVKAAEENITLNMAGGSVRVANLRLERISAQAGLVVANIMAEELIGLSSALIERVRIGGYLILSGIVIEKAEMLKEAFKALSLEKELVEGGWTSLLYRRER